MNDTVWTPIDIERRLTALISELTLAQSQVAEARNLEVAAEITYKRARDRAAAEAPTPKRGEVTVSERDDFIDRATREEWVQKVSATAKRENAQDHLRVVRDQAEIVRSLGASVRTAYEMAGAS